MAIFHELRIQQRELLEQLDELEEAVVELTALLESVVEDDEEDLPTGTSGWPGCIASRPGCG